MEEGLGVPLPADKLYFSSLFKGRGSQTQSITTGRSIGIRSWVLGECRVKDFWDPSKHWDLSAAAHPPFPHWSHQGPMD